ncbi:MAG: apolipoprotein N-acyltransferase [Salaquimonas sp.]
MARLENISSQIVLLFGWKRYWLAFAAGLLSALAMAPIDFFPILFLTLPVFAWIMDGVYADGKNGWIAAVKSPFLCGWWFGFGYFLMGLWWVGNAFLVDVEDFIWLLPFAVLLLPAGLGIFWGLAGVLARLFWSDHWTRVFALTLAFGLFEYLRGFVFTGLPWNALGYAAMPIPLMMQSAAAIGLYGVTALAILFFSLPLILLATPSRLLKNKRIPFILTLLLLVAHLGYGAIRLSQNPTVYETEVTVRLMQPNIDQKSKFDLEQEDGIVARYLDISKSVPTDGLSLEDIDYLIWPESAFPFLLTERRDVLASIGEMLPEGTRLITGAMRAEPGAAGNAYGNVYNSVYLIESNGEIAEAADKTHLVPFGEYLPFQEMLEAIGLEQLTRLRGGFASGSGRKLLAQNTDHPILPLICYEIIFPGEIRNPDRPKQDAPKWIVNLTNDGWFGFTPGPYQHLRQSIVRGVEEGLPIVRVANTGFSVVTDPVGRTLHSLGLGKQGVIDSQLPGSLNTTLYTEFRNAPFFALLILCLLVSLGARLTQRRRQI